MKGKIKIDLNDLSARSNHDEISSQVSSFLKEDGCKVLKERYYPAMELRKHGLYLNECCGEIDIIAMDEKVLMVIEVKSNGGVDNYNVLSHAAKQLQSSSRWIAENKEVVEKYVLNGEKFEYIESVICYESSGHLVFHEIDPENCYWKDSKNEQGWSDRRQYRKCVLGKYRKISERAAKKIMKEMRNHSF